MRWGASRAPRRDARSAIELAPIISPMPRLSEIRRRLRSIVPRRVRTLFYRHALGDVSPLPTETGISIRELSAADVDLLSGVGFIERSDAWRGWAEVIAVSAAS